MNTFTMKAYKYDHIIHYEQPLAFYERGSNYIALKGAIGRKLTHYTRDDVYTFDKLSIEYFFTDQWYTVAFVFNEYNICDYIYCNVCMPSEINDNVVSFIDLDLDVIYDHGEIKIVDQDEFEQHKIKYRYPENIIAKAIETADLLVKAINEKKYPFSLYI